MKGYKYKLIENQLIYNNRGVTQKIAFTVFANFSNCSTDSITCDYVQFDQKNVQSVNTPFKFNGTHLVRIDKKAIPLGSYRYYVACTYDS